MKKGNNLKWFAGMLSLVLALVWLTGCDDDNNGGGGGGTGTNAPASIAGRSINHTINDGGNPFPAGGSFVLAALGAAGDVTGAYTITGSGGVTNSSGTYSYTMTDTNTAALHLEDTTFGPIDEQLGFLTPTTGTFSVTAGGGSASGTFILQ